MDEKNYCVLQEKILFFEAHYTELILVDDRYIITSTYTVEISYTAMYVKSLYLVRLKKEKYWTFLDPGMLTCSDLVFSFGVLVDCFTCCI